MVMDLSSSSSSFTLLQHLAHVPQKLYEAATDCICAALFVCEDVDKYESLATFLQQQVEYLLEVFQAAVDMEDTDR